MSAFEGTACNTLEDVQKMCAQHALGLSNGIDIADAADLESIPEPGVGTHTITTDIVMDTGKVFYPWKIGATDAEFNSTSIGSKGNQSYKNTLTIFIPLGRDAISHLVNNIINGEYVIRFGDKSGAKRLLGSDLSPAMIAEGGIQEVLTEEKNGHTLTFENIGHTPYFYTGAIPLTP